MKKHDIVCSLSPNPRIGYVVRVGDGWLDVEWHAGIAVMYRERCRETDVVPIARHLENAVREASASGKVGEV